MRLLHVWPALLLAVMIGFPKESFPAQNVVAFDWKQFGQQALANKSRPLLPTEGDRARYIISQVAEKMAQLGVKPNGTWTGRFGSALQYGTQDVGTCGWCDSAAQAALLGAGFKVDQLYTIVGEASTAAKYGTLWVNKNHAGTGVVINGKLVVFDLWSHGMETGSFKGMATGKWNGTSFSKWAAAVKHYPRFRWVHAKGSSTNSSLFPQNLEQDLISDYWSLLRPKIKPKSKALAVEMKGAHWQLIGTETKKGADEPLKTPRYFRYTADGSKGSLKAGAAWNDIGLKDFSCSTTFTWSFDKPIETLKPGTKLTITGSVSIGGDHDRGSAGAGWGSPGLPPHVVQQGGKDIGGVEVFGKGGQARYEKTTEVPPGSFFGGKMVLRFVCYARGMASFDYIYKWAAE